MAAGKPGGTADDMQPGGNHNERPRGNTSNYDKVWCWWGGRDVVVGGDHHDYNDDDDESGDTLGDDDVADYARGFDDDMNYDDDDYNCTHNI